MKKQLILTVALVAIGVQAEVKFKADGEKGSAKKLFQPNKALVETDEKTYKVTGHGYVNGKINYEIKPGKKYVLKGKFRSPDAKPFPTYFGLVLMDAKKKVISPADVNALPKTETTLAEACKKTDTVLKLKDASKWKVHSAGGVAFKVDLSGKYGDLPTKNISAVSSRGITSVKKVGDIWEVTLKKAVGRDYPAGTAVREQVLYGGYMYCAASNKRPGKKMKEYKSKVISETAAYGAPVAKWWPGTKFARIIVIVNYGDKTGKAVTEFDDIILEEID